MDAIAASGTAGGPARRRGQRRRDLAQLQYVVQTIGASHHELDGFYQQFVTKLGVDTDQATRLHQVQSRASSTPPQSRRDGVSGVNLDEEMSDMVRFQKSYNAAARMVTTLDEMLDTIVSRMGVVGR